jgi:DNA-binding transcriptional regulator YiaG
MFGTSLQKRRKKLKVAQNRFARLAGVSTETLRKYELNELIPSAKERKRLNGILASLKKARSTNSLDTGAC